MSRRAGNPGQFRPARPLLKWFDRHHRDLPWRRTRDPYAIWLSETMLQQTQVATVIPYYQCFLRRFPTVRRLAAASLDGVLRLWAGLGYYARARNLHAAARRIVADHAGRIPDTVEALLTLPGVGRCTAGAVASIAFDRRAPVVDGNVARVLVRLFALPLDPMTAAGRAQLWGLAESLLPARRCGDFNQALMELGATICTPALPKCPACPLRGVCRAARLGVADRRPARRARTARRSQTFIVAAVRHDGHWRFVRRPPGGLWGGLWELPTAPLNGSSPRTVLRELAAIGGLPAPDIEPRPFCSIRHELTHLTAVFVGHVCRVRRPDSLPGRWRRLDDLVDLAMSRAMRRVLDALRAHLVGQTPDPPTTPVPRPV